MSLIQVDWNPNERQLRTFGGIATVVCLALGALTLWRGSIVGIELTAATAGRVAYALGAIAVVSGLLAVTAPRALKPVYVLATAISLPIGFVVSYLVLGVLFYLVLTPFALAFRLIGRDALARSFDRTAPTYWVPRTRASDISRYYHQY